LPDESRETTVDSPEADSGVRAEAAADQALALQVPVSLEHRVRVDRQLGDYLLGGSAAGKVFTRKGKGTAPVDIYRAWVG